MKRRTDLIIRFAANGIIVMPNHPDYSREAGQEEELVFNNVVTFEKWFEAHTGESDDDDHWPMLRMRDHEPTHVVFPESALPRYAFGKLVLGDGAKQKLNDDFKDAMIYGTGFNLDGKRIHPGRIVIDPAVPAETCAIAPLKQEPPDEELVDALREAENVVKRFTGVK